MSSIRNRRSNLFFTLALIVAIAPVLMIEWVDAGTYEPTCIVLDPAGFVSNPAGTGLTVTATVFAELSGGICGVTPVESVDVYFDVAGDFESGLRDPITTKSLRIQPVKRRLR